LTGTVLGALICTCTLLGTPVSVKPLASLVAWSAYSGDATVTATT
jgi:hypothetical protein